MLERLKKSVEKLLVLTLIFIFSIQHSMLDVRCSFFQEGVRTPSGGDKPRPYITRGENIVGAGFIPARRFHREFGIKSHLKYYSQKIHNGLYLANIVPGRDTLWYKLKKSFNIKKLQIHLFRKGKRGCNFAQL
jgi:hypothetical protein